MLGYLLIALAPVAGVAWIVWSYRKKAAAQAAARGERLEQLFGAGGALPARSAGRDTVPQMSPPPAPASPVPLYARQDRLLGSAHTRLYRLLRQALPEHEIFPQVRLAALLDVPPSVQGRTREQRQRALAQYDTDCVVCDGDLRVVAVVEFEAPADTHWRLKSGWLEAAGVRYVRIAPGQLPTAAELQSLILG